MNENTGTNNPPSPIVDDFENEVARVRANPELMKFLDERSKDTKKYTLAEVRTYLGLD